MPARVAAARHCRTHPLDSCNALCSPGFSREVPHRLAEIQTRIDSSFMAFCEHVTRESSDTAHPEARGERMPGNVCSTARRRCSPGVRSPTSRSRKSRATRTFPSRRPITSIRTSTACSRPSQGTTARRLEQIVVKPLPAAQIGRWEDVIERLIDRAVRCYKDNPAARKLLIDGKSPSDIKLADRIHDRAIGSQLEAAIARHFVLPEFPERSDVFYHAVEIVDVLMQVSAIRFGRITPAMVRHVKIGCLAYLRELPPRCRRLVDPYPATTTAGQMLRPPSAM